MRVQFRNNRKMAIRQKGGRKGDTAAGHGTNWYTQHNCVKCYLWKGTATNIPKEMMFFFVSGD
jgi:hypothetical protein